LTEALKTYDVEKIASSTNLAGKTGYLYAENEIRSISFTCTRINSKWIEDHNIKT
jgi:hypothetical protein